MQLILIYSLINILINLLVGDYFSDHILLFFTEFSNIFTKLFMFRCIDAGNKNVLFLNLIVEF
jgi:hypothetical protein